MPDADGDRARIHYEVVGSGEPLLLVMGYGLSGQAWLPMLPMLGAYRAILLDNRGSGASVGTLESITMETFAADAAAVLDHAGIRRAHVHGVSMGGMIALQLALDRPDLVHSLVLGCTTPSPLRFLAADGQAAVELFEVAGQMGSDPDTAVDRILPLLFSARFLADNPSMREVARGIAGSAPLDASAPLQMMKAIADLSTGRFFDVAERLGDVRSPTLVQHGSDDRIIPVEAGRYLGENIPGAEYQELEGAGHAYAMERPLEAFPRMIGFLSAHGLS